MLRKNNGFSSLEKYREYHKKYRKKNAVRIRELKRIWDKHHKDYDKKYQEKNKDRIRELHRLWWEKNKHKKNYYNSEKKKVYNKNKYIKDKQKSQMYNKLNYLQRKNILKIKSECSRCKSNKDIIKHHKDYSKPFEFEILCKSCHNKIHNIGHRKKKTKFDPSL